MRQRSENPARRSRLQLSLRESLILIALIGFLCAYVFKPLGEKTLDRRAAQRMEEMGATVSLHQIRGLGGRVKFLSRFYPAVVERVTAIKIPSQLHKPLTIEHIKSIASLPYLSNIAIEDVGMTDEMLAELSRCQSLQVVTIDAPADSNLTADGMRCFEKHPNINYFQILGTKLNNKDFRAILETLPSVPSDQVEGKIFRRVRAGLPLVVFHSFPEPKRNDPDFIPIVSLTATPEVLENIELLDGLNRHIKIYLRSPDAGPDIVAGLSQLKDLRYLYIFDTGQSGNRVSNPDLFSQLVPLRQLEHLSCRCAKLPESLDSLALLPSLVTLELAAGDLRDQDLVPLAKAPKLKVLRLPQAIITSRCLEIFAEAGKQFETMELPATFRDMKQSILDSGLSENVEISANSPGSDPTDFRFLNPFLVGSGSSQTESRLRANVEHIREIIKDNHFPKPADSPDRPEDYILRGLRRQQLELAGKVGDATRVRNLLGESIAGSARAAFPLERLVSDPVAWREHLETETSVANRSVQRVMRRLVNLEREANNFDKALEWYVRSDMAGRRMLTQPERFEIDLAVSLCQNCSEKMHHVRDSLFTVPENKNVSRIEKASSLTWYEFSGGPGRAKQEFVCILAPRGRRIKKLTAEHDRLDYAKVTGSTSVRQLPKSRTFVFVNAASFPLSVSLSDFQDDVEESVPAKQK